MRYAEHTEVPADKSKAEIERTLARYGATSFMIAAHPGAAVVMFEMSNRQVKFKLDLPDRSKFERRTAAASEEAYQRAIRQPWRALLLVIKGKLESMESGIEAFDAAFGSQIILANGQTTAEWLKPQLDEIYGSGRMPRMIPQLALKERNEG